MFRRGPFFLLSHAHLYCIDNNNIDAHIFNIIFCGIAKSIQAPGSFLLHARSLKNTQTPCPIGIMTLTVASEAPPTKYMAWLAGRCLNLSPLFNYNSIECLTSNTIINDGLLADIIGQNIRPTKKCRGQYLADMDTTITTALAGHFRSSISIVLSSNFCN